MSAVLVLLVMNPTRVVQDANPAVLVSTLQMVKPANLARRVVSPPIRPRENVPYVSVVLKRTILVLPV